MAFSDPMNIEFGDDDDLSTDMGTGTLAVSGRVLEKVSDGSDRSQLPRRRMEEGNS